MTIPVGAARPPGEAVARLLAAGYGQLWTAETAGADAFAPLLVAGPAAPTARLGTAVASIFSRGPGLLAMQAAALADCTPAPVAIGLGVSSRVMAESWNDRPYARPRARMEDTIRFLRQALTGERVSDAYDTFQVRSFRLDRPPATAPALLVAALRPAMLRVGAELADGVILNWLSAADVETVAAHLPAGRSPEVAARIFVVPSDDADRVRAAARPLIARYLSVPGYADAQRWMGRADALAGMWDAAARRDHAAAAAAIPDEVVDALIVHGSPAACAAHVQRYVAAGVTTPVVKVLPLLDDRDDLDDAVAVGEALTRTAPSPAVASAAG